MNYTFGIDAAGGERVPAAFLYDTKGAHSFGFLTEENRNGQPQLRIAELNDGFAPVYWAKDFIHTNVKEDAHGCYVDWDGEGALPLTFVCDVPREGNYAVEVTLYAGEDAQALLFLGRRRLAARVALAAGETWSGRFLTNICPIIPRGYETPMEDLTLDVTVVGVGVHFNRIEVTPWEGPTIYIAGDSTVTDQSADYPYLPGSSYCGWGQMLSAYVGRRFPVSNHAHSGLTTESFREEGHYAILYERIKPGDICLIQFGHNDQKLMHLLAEGGYRDNLIRYLTGLLEKGARPMLVTPLARNSWMGGSGAYNDLLADYARVCREVGAVFRIPVLDLHEKSMAFVKREGREAAKRYFFPSDYTHSNDYGAYLFAGFVYEELAREKVLEETVHFAGESDREASGQGSRDGADEKGWQQSWEPPQVLPVLCVPEEYAQLKNPADEHLFEDLERPQDVLNRAEALSFVVETLHFFPTNVYNDMFTDVIGHETYAGAVECAWQNGLIPQELIENNTLQPTRDVDGNTFLRILLNGYATRKDLPAGGDVENAQALGILPERFDGCAPLTRRMAADMCRKISI